MYRTLSLSALIAVLAGSSAFAAATCSTTTPDKFKPQADLQKMLEGDGLQVRQIKVEKGCYEVYAVDKAGKKVNAAYNAETLEKTASAEAGEN